MPALDIPVPAEESIGTSIPLVILSDTKTKIAPKVEATGVVSPVGRDAHRWNLVDNWRHQEGEPRYEMEEGPLAQIHSITGEPIHRTIPLLMARLVHLDRQIEKNHDHQREVSVARVETSEQEIEALRARATSAEAHVAILHDVLWIAGDRI
nr:hypothetical protein [Tanacetum cinerariifolium]GEW56577.1 hypothetical protein [Tanacetum cinerariifolium]